LQRGVAALKRHLKKPDEAEFGETGLQNDGGGRGIPARKTTRQTTEPLDMAEEPEYPDFEEHVQKLIEDPVKYMKSLPDVLSEPEAEKVKRRAIEMLQGQIVQTSAEDIARASRDLNLKEKVFMKELKNYIIKLKILAILGAVHDLVVYPFIGLDIFPAQICETLGMNNRSDTHILYDDINMNLETYKSAGVDINTIRQSLKYRIISERLSVDEILHLARETGSEERHVTLMLKGFDWLKGYSFNPDWTLDPDILARDYLLPLCKRLLKPGDHIVAFDRDMKYCRYLIESGEYEEVQLDIDTGKVMNPLFLDKTLPARQPSSYERHLSRDVVEVGCNFIVLKKKAPDVTMPILVGQQELAKPLPASPVAKPTTTGRRSPKGPVGSGGGFVNDLIERAERALEDRDYELALKLIGEALSWFLQYDLFEDGLRQARRTAKEYNMAPHIREELLEEISKSFFDRMNAREPNAESVSEFTEPERERAQDIQDRALRAKRRLDKAIADLERPPSSGTPELQIRWYTESELRVVVDIERDSELAPEDHRWEFSDFVEFLSKAGDHLLQEGASIRRLSQQLQQYGDGQIRVILDENTVVGFMAFEKYMDYIIGRRLKSRTGYGHLNIEEKLIVHLQKIAPRRIFFYTRECTSELQSLLRVHGFVDEEGFGDGDDILVWYRPDNDRDDDRAAPADPSPSQQPKIVDSDTTGREGDRPTSPTEAGKPDTSNRISDAHSKFLDQSPVVSTLLTESREPVFFSVSTAIIDGAVDRRGVIALLNTIQRFKNAYVWLYDTDGAGRFLTEEEKEREYGIGRKDIDEAHEEYIGKRENTVALFPVSQGIEEGDLRIELTKVRHTLELRAEGPIKNTIMSPVGTTGDPCGLIRSIVLGVDMAYIARQNRQYRKVHGYSIQKDKHFIKNFIEPRVLAPYREHCAALGIQGFNLTAQDLIQIATGRGRTLIEALRDLIRTLPPITSRHLPEEVRQTYERTRLTLESL